MKTKRIDSVEQMGLELKYCERCGALRLRPTGGEQIYCVVCAREMAELPPTSHEPETARVPQGLRRGAKAKGHEEDEGVDIDAFGGVA